MKKIIEKRALELYNFAANHGLNSSYLSCLQSMYEVASEKKQYERCYIIQELICEEINSEY